MIWLFKKRKKGSIEEARKRLKILVNDSRRRKGMEVMIPANEFGEDPDAVKKKFREWAAKVFDVPENKVKIDLERREGYLVIIANIIFDEGRASGGSHKHKD